MTRTARAVLAAAAAAALLLAAPAAASAAGPATSIDDAPAANSPDTTPTFRFSADEADVRFDCRVVAIGSAEPAFAPCTSPFTQQLADGRYRFEVRATDAAGNVDETPATHEFTIDTTKVDTEVEAGPEGLTRDATPSFTFGTATAGSTYECRLEGPGTPLPAFTACSSPWRSPRLASGSWTLLVRAIDPAGRIDPTPAERRFDLDAVAPDTQVSGPSGNVAVRRPEVTFTGTDDRPGALTYECRADNDARGGSDTVAWASCTSGWQPPELASGKRTIEVRAIDAAGNPDPSPATTTVTVSVCRTVVRFGVVEARATCLEETGEDRWTSKGQVKLNGIPIGTSSSKVTLERGAGGSGGKIAVSVGEVSILGIKLFDGQLGWDLPKGGPGDEGDLQSVDLSGAGQKLLGLDIKGTVKLRLGRTKDDRYYAVGAINVELPSIFKAGPDGNAGGVTGAVAVKMDHERGVRLDGAKIQVDNAYIGRVGVKQVCFSFVAAGGTAVAPCTPPTTGGKNGAPFLDCGTQEDKDRFDGNAAIVLPTPTNTEIGLWAGVAGGRLAYAGAAVEGLGQFVPLGPGVFLSKVALAVCLDPQFKLKGGAEVVFGPEGGIAVDGSILYEDPYKGPKTTCVPFFKPARCFTAQVDLPWHVRAEGGLTLFDWRLAEADLDIWGDGLVDFGFRAGFDFGVGSVHGSVDGWFILDGSNRFSLEGGVKACIDAFDACAGVSGVVSSRGIGACVDLLVTTAGIGLKWGESVDVIGSGCRLSRWAEPKPRAVARAAQDGPLTVDVPQGVDAYAIRVDGAGGAPRVAFVGPDGRRIESPEGGRGVIDKSSHMLAQVGDQQHTAVVITNPAPGPWRIEPLDDAVKITGVKVARERPEPRIETTLSAPDRGGVRTLRYRAALAADEEATIVEKGVSSLRPLGRLRGTADATAGCGVRTYGDQKAFCGAIRFRPADGVGGRRSVEAAVEREGVPRPVVGLASYLAPKRKLPGRPRKVVVRRSKGRAVIGVTPAAGAHKTLVKVDVADGRVLAFESRSRKRFSVRVPSVERRHGVVVRARSMRKDLRVGPHVRRTLHSGVTAVPAPKKSKSRRTR